MLDVVAASYWPEPSSWVKLLLVVVVLVVEVFVEGHQDIHAGVLSRL